MVENMTELKPDICVTAGEQGLVAWLLKRLRVSMLYNTIQYNTIQYNTIQYNTSQNTNHKFQDFGHTTVT